MSNTGNLFPATAEQATRVTGATSWNTPANAVSDNALDTTCNNSANSGSQYLVCRNFGFVLPTSTIGGITVRIELSESGPGTETISVQLQNDAGALIGTAKTFTASGTGKVVYTLGSISDLWGATLTPAIVNNANFGFRIWFTTGHSVQIDYATLAVEYVPVSVTAALSGIAPVSGMAGSVVAIVEVISGGGGGVFPGPIFPGPIFPGPIFPGGGGEAGDSLTSVQASIAVGTIVPSTHKPLTGVQLSADVGFVTTATNVVASLSGVSSTVAAGVIVSGGRSQGLTGVTATARVGSVSRAFGVALTGVTASIGTGVSGGGAGSAWGSSWGDSWGSSWGSGSAGISSAWGQSWGDSWGDSWGAGDPGIGTVVPNTAVTVPGVVLDAAINEVVEVRIQALSGGVTLQAQVGFVASDPNAVGSLSGVAVTVAVGSVIAPLVGNAVTASVGTVLASTVYGLTGFTAGAANGTLVALGTRGLIGLAVGAQVGLLLAARTVSLSGVTVTVAVGTPQIPTQLAAMTGVDFGADVGSLALVESAAILSGVDVTATVDSVTTTADRERALTGVEASIDVGFITAQNDVLAILSGVDLNAAVGTLEVVKIETLAGVSLSAVVGTLGTVSDRTAALSGVAVTVRAETIIPAAIPLPTSGVAASATVGTLVPQLIRVLSSVQVTVRVGHTPKEGDVIVDGIGVDVVAGSLGQVGVGPIAIAGADRHTGIRPAKKTPKDLERLDREMALMED